GLPGTRKHGPASGPGTTPPQAATTAVCRHGPGTTCAASGLHDDGVADLVGEGLAFVIPQRPEEAEVAQKAVQEVRELAHERHAEADGLAGLRADQPDAGRALADRLPGGALLVADPKAARQGAGETDEHQQGPERGAAVQRNHRKYVHENDRAGE